MKASVGDRIVVASARLDGPVPGRIVQVRPADGAPPHLPQCADHGRRVLFCPGPDAHVLSQAHTGAAEAAGPWQVRHVGSWQVRVGLFETEEEASVHAVLITEVPTQLDRRGTSSHPSGERDPAGIADEIAVARTLRRLPDRLFGSAGCDVSAIGGHPVSLPG